MSGRTKWTFQYTAADIITAASKKVEHHLERAEWWAKERAKAETAIKESGIEIRENEYTGGAKVEVLVDATLGKRLAECNKKIGYHTHMVDVFMRWQSATKRWAADHVEELDIDDVEFFGL